ncbi:MAG: CDP-alcohol phosphatidyltransferase family protein [bacterium]|nr:CDP-alcohol phosphatidyltransferase family protein [bacterium]
MTEILAAFSSFYGLWKSFIEPAARAAGRVTTANTITVIRTFGAPIVIVLIFFDWPLAAFILFLVSAVADSFDGAVAGARKRMGFVDNPKLGEFMDAFCDKLFFTILLVGILPMGSYESVPLGFRGIMVVTCITLFLIELALAGVRMSDYQHELRMNGIEHKERLLKATAAGKLKFLLENIGVGGLVFSQPDHHHWAFYVAMTSFLLALPFALKSLVQKLRARRILS